MTCLRAGVIVNTSAGKFEYIRKRISKLKEVFDEIVTGSGRFGGDFLEDVKIVDIVSSDFKSAIRELTIELSKCSDVIVSVGGDGTANFIAATLIDEKLNTPIMGIAGGTANVGPLVRFSLENIEKPSHIDFVDCLKVWKGNEHIGYAFIDVVFGDTFLGTLNGKMVNLSVKDFLESGRKVEIIPCDDIAEELDVLKNGRRISLSSKKVAQIIASPLNFSEFYIGKAVTGKLSWASFFKSVGILTISNRVIVDSYLKEHDLEDPVLIEQILFRDGETIEVSGIKRGVYIVLDGNPMCECDYPIKLQGLRKCVKVLSGSQKAGWPVGWKK